MAGDDSAELPVTIFSVFSLLGWALVHVLPARLCKQEKPRPTKQAHLVVDADAGAEPHPVLPQPLRLVSKTGFGTKQASLVADDVAGDDSAELPVTNFSLFSVEGLGSRIARTSV